MCKCVLAPGDDPTAVNKYIISYQTSVPSFDIGGWTESGFGKILVWRVVGFGRVCGELLSKGRQWVVTWRTTGREWAPGLGNSRGRPCLSVVTLNERLVIAWN